MKYLFLIYIIFTSLQVSGNALNSQSLINLGHPIDSTKKKTELKKDTMNKASQAPETVWPKSYPSDTLIHSDADVPPEFKGGNDALYEFMINNLNYPAAQQDSGISGHSIVLFIVEPDGSVSHAKIEKSSRNAALDKEALRVVKKLSGRFKPGKVGGKAVRTYCRLPINFELE